MDGVDMTKGMAGGWNLTEERAELPRRARCALN